MEACKYMRWANFSDSFLGQFQPVFQQILHFVAHTPRPSFILPTTIKNGGSKSWFIYWNFETNVFSIIFTARHLFFEFIFCSFVFFASLKFHIAPLTFNFCSNSLHFLVVCQKRFRRNGIHKTSGANANDLWGGKCLVRLIDSRNLAPKMQNSNVKQQNIRQNLKLMSTLHLGSKRMCVCRAIFHRRRWAWAMNGEPLVLVIFFMLSLLRQLKQTSLPTPLPIFIFSRDRIKYVERFTVLFFQTLFLHKCGCFVVVCPTRAYRHFIGDIFIEANRTAWPPQLVNVSELESKAWHDRVWALGCVYRLLL